ncbi:MAG: DNA-binding protein [Candidatus Methanofastidiosia archaeon]
MEDVEEIRRKKLEELKAQQDAEQQRIQQELQKQVFLKQIMTSDARERLVRIKMANPQFAERVELFLIQMAQSGKLGQRIDDNYLKKLLSQLSGKKREFRIRRR